MCFNITIYAKHRFTHLGLLDMFPKCLPVTHTCTHYQRMCTAHARTGIINKSAFLQQPLLLNADHPRIDTVNRSDQQRDNDGARGPAADRKQLIKTAGNILPQICLFHLNNIWILMI